MTNRTKIVFLGATSMSFGLSMLRDIFASGELHGSTLTLVGRNPATLAKMTELAKLLNNKTDTGLIIEHTTDRRATLGGKPALYSALRLRQSWHCATTSCRPGRRAARQRGNLGIADNLHRPQNA